MSSTVFVNGVTLTDDDWFNDVNRIVYTILADAATALTAKTALGISYGRATADQSITTNTTLASATNMSFSIAASEEWIATFDLDIGAALLTTGIKLAVTVPAGATLNFIAGLIPFSVDTGGSDRLTRRTTTGGAALDFTTATLPGADNAMFRLSVWVLNSTNAGTVQLQIAQSTSSGTALVLRKGSFMRADRIA